MAQSETDPLVPRKDSEEEKNEPSTGRQILDLAVPAGAALLIDPLMTLADTAFVGRYSDSADQLAGMGSAAALLTFSFYIFNFLCTVTTPIVSAARASGNRETAMSVGGQALSLSLLLGFALTATLLVFRQQLLLIMGTGITGEDANMYALQFLAVRAFAAPAVLSLDASTGILRGYLDTKTPIVVLIGANLLNLMLDVVLIAYAGMGPMGAAIATTSAEWVSALLFLGVLAGRLPSASGLIGSNVQGEAIRIAPSRSLPAWREIKPLVVASSSAFFRSLTLQLSISSAAAMAARVNAPDVAPYVAAHQIGIQLWILCSFFCDSLAAASQGLVADALGRQNKTVIREICSTVFQYSLGLGLFLAAVIQTGCSTEILFDLFTKDSTTRSILSQILPLIIVAQPLNALVFAADGVLQGANEFPFQAKAMLLSGATAAATFLVLDLGSDHSGTLMHVWLGLISLQTMRGITSVVKLVDKGGPIDLLANWK